jgi:hypothetical protein
MGFPNINTMFKHELGVIGKDKITGFKGVLTSRCEFLTGCNRYCIQPQELKEGKPIEGIYFDEEQIEIIGEGISKESVRGKENGACAPNPIK